MQLLGVIVIHIEASTKDMGKRVGVLGMNFNKTG